MAPPLAYGLIVMCKGRYCAMCTGLTLSTGKDIPPLTFQRDSATGKTAWRWQALPAPRPLYNLDKLAANPTAVVTLTEGEKPADAAAELFPECVTTTTLNGAQSPHKTDFSPLQGRSVRIWPDNDKAGCEYAERVAALLDRYRPGGETDSVSPAITRKAGTLQTPVRKAGQGRRGIRSRRRTGGAGEGIDRGPG